MIVRDGYKLTEVGEVPEEWKVKSICDFCITSSGGTPNRNNSEFYLNGEIPWIKTGELSTKYLFDSEEKITLEALRMSSAKLFSVNTILVAMYGATIGKSSILKTPAATNQACCAIMPDQSLSEVEYVYYAIQNRVKDLIELGAGGAQPNISQTIIGSFPIPLPPLPEQQKIADILSTVDEHISETESLIEKTKVLKQGMMQQLLTKGIGHTEFKDTAIGKIPVEWEIEFLRDVAEIISGGTPSTTVDEYWVAGDIPWATPTDITLNGKYISKTNQCITAKGLSSSSAYLLPMGSILMTSRATIGACSINTVPMSTNQGFKSLISGNRSYNEFLYYLILNRSNELKKLSSGSTFTEISKKSMESLLVPVPSISEQKKIADILATVDNQIDSYQTKLTSLTKLKSALMQQLLTGKTRVKV